MPISSPEETPMASKKKTIAQRAVGLATPVMPAPVATVVGTRWGSRLFLLLLPFLLATGILTVSWNNGIPTVNFDRARAWIVGRQVGQRVEAEAMRAAQEYGGQPAGTGAGQGWGQSVPQPQPQPNAWQQQPQSWQQPVYQQQPYQQAPQYAPQFPPPQQAAQPYGPRAYR
jgi:hypothetical protein